MFSPRSCVVLIAGNQTPFRQNAIIITKLHSTMLRLSYENRKKTYLYSSLVGGGRPRLCQVVYVIVDVSVVGVVVRPQRRKHGKTLFRCRLLFAVAQQFLSESVRVPALEVQSERSVTVRVDLLAKESR